MAHDDRNFMIVLGCVFMCATLALVMAALGQHQTPEAAQQPVSVTPLKAVANQPDPVVASDSAQSFVRTAISERERVAAARKK